MDNNTDYKRRCAVSKAWANERQQVLNSKGSRNWSQKEQVEIIRTGRCHGYRGHHMLSVKAHPEQAMNENDIQFLTQKEHFKAHGGNWKNDADGRYNLRTGKVKAFDKGKPYVNYRQLSDPISERSRKIANTKYLRSNNTRTKANNTCNRNSNREPLPVRKSETNFKQMKMEHCKELFNKSSSSGEHSILDDNDAFSGKKQAKSVLKGKGQRR